MPVEVRAADMALLVWDVHVLLVWLIGLACSRWLGVGRGCMLSLYWRCLTYRVASIVFCFVFDGSALAPFVRSLLIACFDC